jgi:hypothetical protein
MKHVAVYHQNQPDHLAVLLGRNMPVDDMRKVATFETDLPVRAALEEAFRLTNHHGTPWPLRPELRAEPGPHTSTSVGDVVVVDGEAYQCVDKGWRMIEGFRP